NYVWVQFAYVIVAFLLLCIASALAIRAYAALSEARLILYQQSSGPNKTVAIKSPAARAPTPRPKPRTLQRKLP
ncbi:MAG: hypothetical protein AAFW81_11280, partial [Pseudomonadota bacterium]